MVCESVFEHWFYQTEVLAALSCLTLCDPMDYSPPGSSVHGILRARILEWVAISFSRGSSWPRDQALTGPDKLTTFFLIQKCLSPGEGREVEKQSHSLDPGADLRAKSPAGAAVGTLFPAARVLSEENPPRHSTDFSWHCPFPLRGKAGPQPSFRNLCHGPYPRAHHGILTVSLKTPADNKANSSPCGLLILSWCWKDVCILHTFAHFILGLPTISWGRYKIIFILQRKLRPKDAVIDCFSDGPRSARGMQFGVPSHPGSGLCHLTCFGQWSRS